jgi:hypothetical protein
MNCDARHQVRHGLALILLACATCAAGAVTDLISSRQFAFADRLPEDVRVVPAPGVDEANQSGALAVEHSGTGTVWVPLFESSLGGVDRVFSYRAQVASRGLQGRAYLEMWCSIGGSDYFSKGLDDPVMGTSAWSAKEISFQSGPGQGIDKITLGLRFEGPGTVMIDHVSLTRTRRFPIEAYAGVFGGFFGCLCGLWGALAGFLSPRGKARGFVLGFGMLLAVSAVALLTIGIVLAMTGQAMALWYASVLCGGIGIVVIVPLWFVVRYRYQQAELRRMTAMDLT